jgi:alkanesulfonate monooxygenase SsuD/methylene tetrahydromethanopterin reductase-like flavin-dependent oxidoreductase (luciferase family)
MAGIPLSILDLMPISSGSTAPQALRNSADLARQAEQFGYARHWFAEHHLSPGMAASSPAVVIALVAASTSRIRVGAGAVQLGHRTSLSTVEEFGLLDAAFPGRIDLGLGRSNGRTSPPPAAAKASTPPPAPEGRITEHGLRIPPRFRPGDLLAAPHFTVLRTLLQQAGAETQDYDEQVAEILALLSGDYRSADGIPAHATPGEGADVQVWVLGSSAGQSARTAGARSLRFAANYHVSPATVLEAVDGYRAAFVPSEELPEPYVSVSADVVVAPTEDKARELASGYGLWVRSIRTTGDAIPFPTPAEAAAHQWSDRDHAVVADRIQTRFVGSPKAVADQLEILQEATGADELVITTITHDHADRIRSYELLAQEWSTR